MNIFQRIKAVLALREAIRKADDAYLNGGGRYYVMPTEDGKLIVMSKKDFQIMKRKRYIGKDTTTRDMLNECFYFTPYKDGHGIITNEQRNIKAEQYMRWVEATQQLKKQLKKLKKLNRKP